MADETLPLPAILLAAGDDGLRCTLADLIRQNGFLVIEAHDRPSALRVAQTHSRPIRLLLIEVSLYEASWAALVNECRPGIRMWFVSCHANGTTAEILAPETAVRNIDRIYWGDKRVGRPRRRCRDRSATAVGG
ncbi:MAG: hypothetical protein LAQ30_23025 [Acidobacteriia bacterium]|nr:hypothetical protein [Terriglobia bacterium]